MGDAALDTGAEIGPLLVEGEDGLRIFLRPCSPPILPEDPPSESSSSPGPPPLALDSSSESEGQHSCTTDIVKERAQALRVIGPANPIWVRQRLARRMLLIDLETYTDLTIAKAQELAALVELEISTLLNDVISFSLQAQDRLASSRLTGHWQGPGHQLRELGVQLAYLEEVLDFLRLKASGRPYPP